MDIDWLAVGALAIGASAFAAEVIRCRLLRAFGPTAVAVGAWVRVAYQAAVLLGVGLLISDLMRYVERSATLPVYFMFGGVCLAALLAIGVLVDRRSGVQGRGPAPVPPARGRD